MIRSLRKIQYKLLIIVIIVVGICSFSGFAFQSNDQFADLPEVKWVYTSSSSENVLFNQQFKMFAERIKEATNGKFIIEGYYSGVLMGAAAMKNAVSRGTVDMCHQPTSIIAEWCDYLYPISVPYVFKDYNHYRTFADSNLYAELVERVAKDVNIRMLRPEYLGFRNLNLRGTKNIQAPDDMKGIKLRVSNNESTLYMAKEVLGANPIGMDFNEVYQALQTGAIDGHENPLDTIKSSSLYEVTDSIILTEHVCEVSCHWINEDSWRNLNPKYQQLIIETMYEVVDIIDEKALATEKDTLQFFKSKGMTIIEPNKEAFIEKAIKANSQLEAIKNNWELYQAVLGMSE